MNNCSISKINIECYFDNYNKLKHVIGEHAAKLNWEEFTRDNCYLFDEKFIKEYKKDITFSSVSVNSEHFQKLFKVYEMLDGYNLDGVSTIRDYEFFVQNKSKLDATKINSFEYHISDEDFLQNIDFYSELTYSCFVRVARGERLDKIDAEVVNKYKAMFIENSTFYDYWFWKDYITSEDDFSNFRVDSISELVLSDVHDKLSEEQINDISIYYSETVSRGPEFYKLLNLKHFEFFDRVKLWRKDKIEFSRVLKG